MPHRVGVGIAVDVTDEAAMRTLVEREVAGYVVRKVTDPERWLAGMRRVRRRLLA